MNNNTSHLDKTRLNNLPDELWKSAERRRGKFKGFSETVQDIIESFDYRAVIGYEILPNKSAINLIALPASSSEGEFVLIGRQGALCGNINYATGKFFASVHDVVCTPYNKSVKIP